MLDCRLEDHARRNARARLLIVYCGNARHSSPPRLHLSEWIEREIVLPEGTSALPGRVRLWPNQREIADAISDPEIERITPFIGTGRLQRAITGAIRSFVANESERPVYVRCRHLPSPWLTVDWVLLRYLGAGQFGSTGQIAAVTFSATGI
jgi:hypothetical protein